MGNEKVKPTRRNFLKTAATLVGSTIAISLLKPTQGLLFAATPKSKTGPWYGIGIDIEKCIGCGRCANACKTENNVPREPFFFRTWIEQYTIKNEGEMLIESPNGGIDGFKQSVPDENIFKSFFVPKMCNHCYKSPCTQVCPVGATYESPEGIVLIDEERCIGCRYCVQSCPYGCRFVNPEKNIAEKCTLCYHRITKGLQPACMEVCPTGARIYGDLRDKQGPLVKFIREHTTHVLRSHLNTGSKLYYNALSEEVR